MTTIGTGGGSYIEGDASAGRDLTGRDNVTTNNFGNSGEPSDRELLHDIHDSIFGNPRKGRQGLVQTIDQIQSDVQRIRTNHRMIVLSVVVIVAALVGLAWLTLQPNVSAASLVPGFTCSVKGLLPC